MLDPNRIQSLFGTLAIALLIGFKTQAQVDPIHRNLIELGYDQPLTGASRSAPNPIHSPATR